MKKIILALLITLSTLCMAEEHQLGNFKGGDVELKVYDHSLAGSVKDFVMFSNTDEESGVSSFTAKKEGKILKTEIRRQSNGTFGTDFNFVNAQGESKSVSVIFKSLNKTENRYVYLLNGKEINIWVKADDFISNHYINPEYTFDFGAEKLVVKMDKGQACYNFSAHLIAVLLTAYAL